jgi:EpsI family protein
VLPDSRLRPWIPAAVLVFGCLALVAVNRQVVMPLVRPLDRALPDSILGMSSRDQTINPEELKIAGVSEYVYRIFGADADSVQLSVYVGYYEAQSQGKTIHSPKNCLPGAGWEPLEQERITLDAGGYRFPVNRSVLEKKGEKALVYYWYQGRGRVSANEYLVKWEQIRDRALRGRSDEALVRIVIPISPRLPLASADSIAIEVSKGIVRPIYSSLPGFPSRPVPAPQAGS